MIDKSENGIAEKENIPMEPLMDETKGNAFGESFKEYAKSIFLDSLITGFPQIVSTRTWKKKLWKSAIFSVCLAGFLYQAREFMAYYWTYPTTTYTKISWPSEVMLPAITFCSNNRRQAYCEEYPSYCYDHRNNSEFCDIYPNYCKYDVGKDSKYTKIPTKKGLMENTIALDWEIAEKLGPTQSMIESCEKIYESGESWRFNCSIHKFPLLIKGYPAYCYTIESQLGQPESEDDILPNNFYFKIELNNFPSEYFKHLDEIFIYAGIHNRRQLINPQKEGVILKGGYDYKIHVSMKQIERLPFPYNTNCTEYLKLWKQNNGSGPLNQDTCIEHCKLKKLKARGLCVDEFTFYEPHTEKVCSVTTPETTTYEMNKHCSMECQPACLEQDYEMEYEEADLETKVKGCGAKVNCNEAYISVRVFFTKFRLSEQIYLPKIVDIELFSYIGGYIGIWLGISFVSICDLLESLSQLFFYAIKTKS